MGIKTPTKAEKQAIIERAGSKRLDEAYTKKELARIMTASHSEIRTVMQEIQEAREKEKTDE